MNKTGTVIILILAVAAAAVYGLSERSHKFQDSKCILCHVDVKKNPANIRTYLTLACNSCHFDLQRKKSHPSDVYPTMTIPEDMPLTDGRLTCLTCHYVHPSENARYFSDDSYFLRRQSRGIFFCVVCHQIDRSRHLVFENVHTGTFTVTDRSSRIDAVSLQCIECHDTHIQSPAFTLGAGRWNHYNREFNHPIGIPYRELTARRANRYKPQEALNREIILYDGKIGCGTCHNIYSKEKNMLAVSNMGSRLCLECHIK